MGMGEGQISWISVDDYCNRLDICGEQREDMQYFIRKMDEAYLSWKAAKSNPNPDGGST